MTSKLSKETIEKIIRFHGHSRPDLSIGIRASELARRNPATAGYAHGVHTLKQTCAALMPCNI